MTLNGKQKILPLIQGKSNKETNIKIVIHMQNQINAQPLKNKTLISECWFLSLPTYEFKWQMKNIAIDTTKVK